MPFVSGQCPFFESSKYGTREGLEALLFFRGSRRNALILRMPFLACFMGKVLFMFGGKRQGQCNKLPNWAGSRAYLARVCFTAATSGFFSSGSFSAAFSFSSAFLFSACAARKEAR